MADWQIEFEPQSLDDWAATLCDRANGVAQNDTYGDWTGTIDDVTIDGEPAVRIAADGPIGSVSNVQRTRTELSDGRVGEGGAAVPSESLYDWEVMIPGWVDLSGMEQVGGGITTINQFHADQNCYGGGTWLDPLNDDVNHRIKGGTLLSSSGSCQHAYDHSFKFGHLVRDVWNRIRIEARWKTNATGYALEMLLGRASEPNSCASVYDVPTQGGAGSGQAAATKVIWRLGWYPPFVPPDGLEMFVRRASKSTRPLTG